MTKQQKLEAVRVSVADYMYSEGCSCCRNDDKHTEAKARLAGLLDVPMYKDKSGFNFQKFRTKNK